MYTNPATRKRYAANTGISGGIADILRGVFGTGAPVPVPVVGTYGNIYHYHEGDLFTPGAENYVFDPFQQTPLLTMWGRAFLRTPNVFNPIQSPQLYYHQQIPVVGIGGMIAGQIVGTPLSTAEPEQ